MQKVTMIINPHSGIHHKKINIKKIKDIFNSYDYDVEIIKTEYKGHAKKIVRETDSCFVISVGGDGTFNEVMTGNFERKERVLLSHIPQGTANDIGAMYGYSNNLYHNIELLLNGKVKDIDICTINDRPFTYVAAFGKYTNISYETPRYLKKMFGYLAYLMAGFMELKKPVKTYDITYKINDVEYKDNITLILISNANRIAGINNFYHNIKLDDDQFEVLFCSLKTKKELMHALMELRHQDISSLDKFKFYKTNNLSIKFNKHLDKKFSVDGEELDDDKLDFNIKIVRNVKIMIPRKNIKKLFLDKE